MTNVHIIAQNVAFVVLAEQKTLSTAMIAECASIVLYTKTTIVRWANTSPTVPFVRNICSRPDRQVTKCHVDMPFIGIVSDSWPHTILVVPFVKRRRKPRSV
jgi:hypothetical protein